MELAFFDGEKKIKVGFNAPVFDLLDIRNPIVQKKIMEDKLLEKLAGEDSGSPCVDDQLLINDDDNGSEGLGSESDFAQTGTYEDFLKKKYEADLKHIRAQSEAHRKQAAERVGNIKTSIQIRTQI